MADNEPKAGEPKEPQQAETVSRKEFDELKGMFEESQTNLTNTQKAQQGSDKKVQELMSQLEEKDNLIAAEKKKAKNANMDKVDLLSEQLKEMADKMEATSRDAARKEFIATGYKLATGMNVPTELVDNYGGKSDGLEDYLKTVKEKTDAQIEAALNEKLSSGYKPKGSGDNGSNGATWDPSKHTKEENTQHYESVFEAHYKEQAAPAQ